MSSITIPILITIAVVGIIAIILVKLFYKDNDDSNLSDELPAIITSHWQEPFDEIHEEKYDNLNENNTDNSEMNEYGFVSKSWEEPMERKEKTTNKITNKIFQEPMHSRQQEIISNEPHNEQFDDLNNTNNLDEVNISSDYSNHMDNHTSEYIIPKKYYSPNNDDENNINHDDENYYDLNNDNQDYYDNIDNSDNQDYYENNDNQNALKNNNLSGYDKNDSLDTLRTLNTEEKVIIGGNQKTIRTGDEVIFNYSGESYSSRILEIKHQNVKVKYRGKEKWINFSDIKKVF